MKKILFIGTFLSGRRGTKGISEKLKPLLEHEFNITLCSKSENKILRLAEICIAILFKGYDKLHIDVFSGQAFRIAEISCYLARFRKKYIILTLRGGKLAEFAPGNQERIDQLFKKAHYIQTPSLFLQHYFNQQGHTVHYLANGIDHGNFPYNRNHIIPYSLLWVRAFTTIYNPALAIHTLFEVRKKYPQATLTMVGPDNGLLHETQEIIGSLNLEEAVTITGPVPNNELPKYYHSHAVYLNTTSYESFGVAVVEAASCGIPVVSTGVGEIPYLWEHNTDMLIVNSFNSSDFSSAVCRIFDHPELAETLCKNARQKTTRLSWEHIVPKWVALLGKS